MFETITLDKFVTLQRGFDLPTQNRKFGSVPVIAASGIAGFHNESKVMSPGVVLGRSGSIGAPQFISIDFWPLNTTLFVKDFHGNNPKFVYYVLKTIDFKRFNAGGTVPTLNRNHLTQISIPKVEKCEQDAISDTLWNLDAKIEANTRLSKTLEEIAQALFKSWFIDFDPVKAKMAGEKPVGMDDATAALFPDSMEDSEFGPVPKGWRFGAIGELANLKGGKQLSKDEFVVNGSSPVFGGAGIMGWTSNSNAEGFVITLGRVGANCGQFFCYRGKVWVNNNATLVEQKGGICGEWLFLRLKNFDIETIKKGAAQPFVSNSDLAESSVLIPPTSLISIFTELVQPLFLMRELLLRQSDSLVSLKDALLPRLISGELQIPEEMLES